MKELAEELLRLARILAMELGARAAIMDVGVIVVNETWLDDPCELELRLPSGAFVKIGWDTDYHHRKLWCTADGGTDYEPCTAEQTGLTDKQLSRYEDEVFRTVEANELAERIEWLADGDQS